MSFETFERGIESKERQVGEEKMMVPPHFPNFIISCPRPSLLLRTMDYGLKKAGNASRASG
jgi:hypothetical protein